MAEEPEHAQDSGQADPVLQQARKRILELRRDLGKHAAFVELQVLEEFVKRYETIPRKGAAARQGRKAADPGLMPFIEGLLEKADGPLTTQEVLDAVQREGFQIGGQSPLRNLSAKLSNADTVVAAPNRAGWLLKTKAGGPTL